MKRFTIPVLFLLVAVLMSACTSSRTYQDTLRWYEGYEEAYDSLSARAEAWQALPESERTAKMQTAQQERLAAQAALQKNHGYDPAVVDEKVAAEKEAEKIVEDAKQKVAEEMAKNAYKNLIPGLITLENDLPLVIDNYDFSGTTVQRSFEIDRVSAARDGYLITITLTGVKTFDREGDAYSSSCDIGWKLYSGENRVADSGTAYSPEIAVGETCSVEIRLFESDIAGGSYTLQLLDVS